MSTLVPPWFLRSATKAKRIFLHSYVGADIFDALRLVFASHERPLAMLEECHVLFWEYHPTRPDGAEAFFRSLDVASIGQLPVFHLYSRQPNDLEQWKEGLFSNGVDVMRAVVVHVGDYPAISLSPAFSDPCARLWQCAREHW